MLLLAVVVTNLVLMHRHGQTIAKRWLGIRVVRSDGSPVSLARWIVLRVLALGVVGVVPLLGPLVSLIDPLLIFRESRKCLHDEIADTIVVSA